MYLISYKSETQGWFQHYLIELKNKLTKSVKTLKTERGREYL